MALLFFFFRFEAIFLFSDIRQTKAIHHQGLRNNKCSFLCTIEYWICLACLSFKKMIAWKRYISMNHEFLRMERVCGKKRRSRRLISTKAGSSDCFERLNEKVKTQSRQSILWYSRSHIVFICYMTCIYVSHVVICTVHLVQKRPNWRITYLLYYLFDYEYSYIYKLAIICSIAHKILVAMVTTFENTSLATAKPAILWQNFQLQSCLEPNFEQLCN